MLLEADQGAFFRAPANVTAQFPQLPTTQNYDELLRVFHEFQAKL